MSQSGDHLERKSLMTYRTSDEAKQEHIRTLGPAMGETFHALCQHVASLYFKWGQYTALYGTSKERVDVLNRSAPTFFSLVQGTILDDVLLHVARLTDRVEHGGRHNLTVQRLPLLMSSSPNLASVRNACETAVKSANFCRELRNKRLAHASLPHALGEGSIDGVSRAQIGQALTDIAEALNAVTRAYTGGETMFDDGMPLGGAEQLLEVLGAGVAARDEMFRTRRGGTTDH
jgi:hypothetical protein